MIVLALWIFTLFSACVFVRSFAVYDFRQRLLDSDPDSYDTLPSYSRMVLEFWTPLPRFIGRCK